MKNRDHSNISKTGSKNLEKSRKARMQPVTIKNDKEVVTFESKAECSKYLADKYNKPFEAIRYKLKKGRSHIFDYDIIYLNAETGRGCSTEQGTVHQQDDLTGNYTTAFNKGKQDEVNDRVKHR